MVHARLGLLFLLLAQLSYSGPVDSLETLRLKESLEWKKLSYRQQQVKLAVRYHPALADSIARLALKEAMATGVDSLIADGFHRVSTPQIYLGRLDSARWYATTSMKLREKIRHTENLTWSYNTLAYINYLARIPDSAHYYYLKAAATDSLMNDSAMLADDYLNAGVAARAAGSKTDALKHLMKALDLYILLKDTIGIAQAYNNLGLHYGDEGDVLESKKYYLNSLRYKALGADTLGMANSWANLYISYRDLNMYDSAFYASNMAYELAGEVLKPTDTRKFVSKRSRAFALLERYDEALEDALLSYKLAEESGDKTDAAIELVNICDFYYRLGNRVQTEFYYSKALNGIPQINDVPALQQVYTTMEMVSEWLGKNDMALSFLRKNVRLRDSLNFVAQSEKLRQLESELELSIALTEKRELELASTEQAALLAEARTRNTYYAAGGLVLLLISAAFFQHRRNREKLQAQEAVTREREEGLRAVFEATENERTRIARDLHDGIGQQLSALKMHIGTMAAHRDFSEESFRALYNAIDTSCDDVRNISHRMMPRTLEQCGLVEALEETIQQAFQHTALQCEFHQLGFDRKARLPQLTEITVYRVAQELIQNAIKHANASKLDIQLIQNPRHVIMVVEDDGKGFVSNTKAGLGLKNISSRLNLVNGSVDIAPGHQRGTTITIKVPLAA